MKVMRGNDLVYAESLPAPGQPRVFSQQKSNDLTYALSQVTSAKLNIGWDTGGKTGTWEFGQGSSENADARMLGYTEKIAAAVWVGNKAELHPLRDKNNKMIYGSGIPAAVWQKFMTAATKALNEKKTNTRFNPPSDAGNTMPPGSVRRWAISAPPAFRAAAADLDQRHLVGLDEEPRPSCSQTVFRCGGR